MNNISTIKDCANCGSCIASCPTSAIRVDTAELFYFPQVDEKKCIDCGKCLTHCPVMHIPDKNEPIAAFGGWSRDEQLVLNSSSGGAFGTLAEKVIADGGVVFGFGFADDHRSVIAASTDELDLGALKKSKYVESLASDSFPKIKCALEDGRTVMFCAAPCQIAGLKAFLGGEYDNLLTCDFACGGFPSHTVYREYIEGLERKYQSKVSFVDFRPKSHGWERHAVLIRFENGRVYNRLGTEDDYLRSFLYGKLTVRDNCLNCRFSNRHAADITLADFWLYKRLSAIEHETGISLILCNTEKGLGYIKSVERKMHLSEEEVEKAAYNNRPTNASENEKLRHDAFLLSCKEQGFSFACQKHTPRSRAQQLKGLMARIKFRKG